MSVYTIATNGLSVQARRFAQQADAIAFFNAAPAPAPANAVPSDPVTFGGQAVAPEHALVGMTLARTGYAADAKIIQTQQEMDKSLLDIVT